MTFLNEARSITLPPDLLEKMLGLMGAEQVAKLAYALEDLCENRSHDEFSRITLCVVTLMTCRHQGMKPPTGEELCLVSVAGGIEPPEADLEKAEKLYQLWDDALATVIELFPKEAS